MYEYSFNTVRMFAEISMPPSFNICSSGYKFPRYTYYIIPFLNSDYLLLILKPSKESRNQRYECYLAFPKSTPNPRVEFVQINGECH